MDRDSLIRTVNLRVDPDGMEPVAVRFRGKNELEVTVSTIDEAELNRIVAKVVDEGKLHFRIIANYRDHEETIKRSLRLPDTEQTLREGNQEIAWWIRVRRPIEHDVIERHIEGYRLDDPRRIGHRWLTTNKEDEPTMKEDIVGVEVLALGDSQNVTGKYLMSAEAVQDSSWPGEGERWAIRVRLNEEGGRLLAGLTRANRPSLDDFFRVLGVILNLTENCISVEQSGQSFPMRWRSPVTSMSARPDA